jgi:carboxyl-terminal processing protease
MKKYKPFIILAVVLSIALTGFVQAHEPTKPINKKQIQRLGVVFEAVRQLYVDEKSDKEIVEHAMEGMLSDLDPHSAYLSGDELRDLNDMTEGGFVGIGIEITLKHGLLQVVTPLDDSPAKKAGIEPGDLIMRVDGKAVRGMKINQVVKSIRGKPGTRVTLAIMRKGVDHPLTVTVPREKIEIDSVRSKVIDQHYGYIRIASFQSNTGDQVLDAIDQLQKKANNHLEGIILDLRNNPGGVMQAAVAVADAFLDVNKVGYDHKVVYTKGRVDEMKYTGYVATSDKTNGMPIVAIINNGSASAAEIVAGALQDHHRALIVGERSFGKGSVQTVYPLGNGDAIKLTTARYYTPSGRAIQAQGVTPDVQIKAWKIPENAKPAESFEIREEGLQSHLAKERQPVDEDDVALMQDIKDQEANEAKKDLIYRDYQLHEAVTLLKALSKLNATKA